MHDSLLASWTMGSGAQSTGRGRRPTVDLAGIVAAGVALADAEGLTGVSMPRVAREVGVTQNALYRHVSSKEELLLLIADAGSGTPPSLDSADWRAAARAWAEALIDRYATRPWLLDVGLRAPFTRNVVLWTEAFLQATRPTGLPVSIRLEFALLLDGHARHVAALRRDRAAAPLDSDFAALLPLMEAADCPEYVSFLRAPAPQPPDFGLSRLLDSMTAYIGRPINVDGGFTA
ncbi:helix-turn-helix domain-containing protein [Dactylosporangium darangshiense]|uniref:TetR/AcrR family transcriptional regulator C-terminal domain-containing protein n=1 Tax=Dactylosporangium darangshiense TaxID=579108 RepID=A0ABP8DL22_9ACTN